VEVLKVSRIFSPSSDSKGNKFGELGYQMKRKSGWRLSGQQGIRVEVIRIYLQKKLEIGR